MTRHFAPSLSLPLPSRWVPAWRAPAHARTDLTLVVDLNSAHRSVRPAPALLQHQPIPLQVRTTHAQPQTVYFGHDRDRFDRRGGALDDADRDGIRTGSTAIRASTMRPPRSVMPGGATSTTTGW